MSLSRPRRGREEEEKDGGRAGGEEPTPAKRPRGCSCACSCCLHHRETKDFCEGLIGILNEQISKQNRRMDLISEQLDTLISEISTPGDALKNSNLRAFSHHGKIRTCRLKFENKCCGDKHSGHVIKADDGNPIRVAIYDRDNRIITNGPLSSMRVKIVVVDGEFNKENKEQRSGASFLKSIVYGRTGKPPLFANELYLRLENGVANLCGVKFQDNVPGKKLRLGVMAADDSISEIILEGISESFSIKAGRGFFNKKDSHPSLSDPIYKLKKIAESGDRRKLLEKMNINRVQDFLRFYNKDSNSLREDCRNISDHDWDIIVGHALSCKPGHERYSYHVPARDATIFFNSLYDIVAAEFNGKYISYEDVNDIQKCLVEASKKKAYDNLKVIQYEDKNSCPWGPCSVTQFPTPPTRFHDDISHHGEVLESGQAQEGPRPRQRWAKIVTVVTTLHFLNKKPQASPEEIFPTPLAESSFEMTYVSDNSLVEPETSDTWDWINMFLNESSVDL